MSLELQAGWSESHVAVANGVHLHVVAAGPPNGPPIILLHGFPEYWWGWRHHIAPLAEAGFRVLVPDQRGYASSDAPPGAACYRLSALVADVLTLADAHNAGRFHLVGHDWGGIVAWAIAAAHPERIAGLSILNAPHLDVVPGVIRRHPKQLLRSGYIAFFQLTGLAEAILRARRFALLKWMMRTTGPSTFTSADLDRYAAQWARPGRLRAMLGYYRALVRRSRQPIGRVTVPTQILWGMDDKALGFPLAQASLALCDRGSLTRFPGASHWLQHDEPEKMGKALVAFHRSR